MKRREALSFGLWDDRPARKLSVICLVPLFFSFSACSGSWDDEVVAPEDFRATYEQLHECKQSAHPAADYVITWLSPDALPIWEAVQAGETDADFEVGAISVKSQYSDSSCSELTGYTLMEKVSTESDAPRGGWKWQFTNEYGECSNCDAGDGCVSCHTGCTSGPSLFCTQP